MFPVWYFQPGAVLEVSYHPYECLLCAAHCLIYPHNPRDRCPYFHFTVEETNPEWNDVPRHISSQFSSVAQSCPTLCNPMDCSMPGFHVHYQLLELAQTHVH